MDSRHQLQFNGARNHSGAHLQNPSIMSHQLMQMQASIPHPQQLQYAQGPDQTYVLYGPTCGRQGDELIEVGHEDRNKHLQNSPLDTLANAAQAISPPHAQVPNGQDARHLPLDKCRSRIAPKGNKRIRIRGPEIGKWIRTTTLLKANGIVFKEYDSLGMGRVGYFDKESLKLLSNEEESDDSKQYSRRVGPIYGKDYERIGKVFQRLAAETIADEDV
jgi:hypothetical protein